MSEYINKKQEEARELMGKYAFRRETQTLEDLDALIETTIKDTLQTLLDIDEMHPKVCMEVNNEQKARDEAFEIAGYNNAITAIRNKITSMLEDNN